VSYEIVFHGSEDGEDPPFFLSSIGAWSQFCLWVETLSATDYPALHRLAADGEVKGTDALSAELAKALGAYPHPPTIGEAAIAVGRTLAELTGVGAAEETATVIM
jgi:hypothetical protein